MATFDKRRGILGFQDVKDYNVSENINTLPLYSRKKDFRLILEIRKLNYHRDNIYQGRHLYLIHGILDKKYDF